MTSKRETMNTCKPMNLKLILSFLKLIIPAIKGNTIASGAVVSKNLLINFLYFFLLWLLMVLLILHCYDIIR